MAELYFWEPVPQEARDAMFKDFIKADWKSEYLVILPGTTFKPTENDRDFTTLNIECPDTKKVVCIPLGSLLYYRSEFK